MAQILSITIIISLAGLVIQSSPALAQFSQQATLFSGKSGSGTFTNFVETYIADLNQLTFDNQAYSTCVTGIWLFYDKKNFNPTTTGPATMEYVFGPANYCVDFQNLAGKPSSARFAGSPKDYRSDTLTLFEDTYFQGVEEYTNIDLVTLNLDGQAASLIVTGSSPWTLYDEPDFGGNSVCIFPPPSNNFSPALIYDTTSLSVPHGTIRSVRKGCWGRRKIFSENLPNGGLVNIGDHVRSSYFF